MTPSICTRFTTVTDKRAASVDLMNGFTNGNGGSLFITDDDEEEEEDYILG